MLLTVESKKISQPRSVNSQVDVKLSWSTKKTAKEIIDFRMWSEKVSLAAIAILAMFKFCKF